MKCELCGKTINLTCNDNMCNECRARKHLFSHHSQEEPKPIPTEKQEGERGKLFKLIVRHTIENGWYPSSDNKVDALADAILSAGWRKEK